MLLPLRQVVWECRVLVGLERGGSESEVVGCRGNGCIPSHRVAKQHVAKLLLAVIGLLLGGRPGLLGLILVVEVRWKDLGHSLVRIGVVYSGRLGDELGQGLALTS